MAVKIEATRSNDFVDTVIGAQSGPATGSINPVGRTYITVRLPHEDYLNERAVEEVRSLR